jgi:hypothetical protein
MPSEKPKFVYSTEQAIPRKEKPVEKPPQASLPPAHQKVTVRLQMPHKKSEELLKQLKARLGTGGTIKGTSFEIQGDHRDALLAALEKMGYTPKRSGG